MIKRILALDGVVVIAHFRDDGELVEAYGLLGDDQNERLVRFAHDYKRIVQGHQDQLSMFTQLRGWTPPRGWIVRGRTMSVCSVSNMVALVENGEGNLTEVMTELTDLASY